MSIFTDKELKSIYERLLPQIKDEITAEDYFRLVENLDQFSLADALTFEKINRTAPIYLDMVGKYNGPQRIGLFANTTLIEQSCINKPINPFNLFRYPIRFKYGDETHNIINGGAGNYASDLYYETSGSSGIKIKVEVKSFVGELESAMKLYGFKDTKTGFPYNAMFLILFNRDTLKYYLVGNDKQYYNYATKITNYINTDKKITVKFDEIEKVFIYEELDWVCDSRLHDVHTIKWNSELVKLAEEILDHVGIKPMINERKNY